jgi:perosamine synthetase
MKEKLAINGGKPAITQDWPKEQWPVINPEDEAAVLDVLRQRKMSGTDITVEFEKEYAQWQGAKYALACNNGTSALHCAMFGIGLRRGDEVISTTWTYWASHVALTNLGVTVIFGDIDPHTLCLDACDVERRITPRTRAIVVPHIYGYPADMDAFMQLAEKYNLKIIEDYSHSHGAVWHGRKVGSIGHVGAASIMTGKPMAAGEGGVLNTDDQEIYERAVMFGHYERIAKCVKNPDWLRYEGLPLGGFKYRMHQMTSAMARVRLKYYDQDRAPGLQSLERLFRQLEDIPGVDFNFPLHDPSIKVASSYCQAFILGDEIINRVPNTVIAEAVRAEGVQCSAGGYYCHHLHPFWNECDVYGDGKPTRLAFADRDVRQKPGDCPVAERINHRLISVPRFVGFDPERVDQIAAAYRKVLTNLDQLAAHTGKAKVDRATTFG